MLLGNVDYRHSDPNASDARVPRSESDYLKRPTVTQYLFISMSLVLSTDGAALCQL